MRCGAMHSRFPVLNSSPPYKAKERSPRKEQRCTQVPAAKTWHPLAALGFLMQSECTSAGACSAASPPACLPAHAARSCASYTRRCGRRIDPGGRRQELLTCTATVWYSYRVLDYLRGYCTSYSLKGKQRATVVARAARAFRTHLRIQVSPPGGTTTLKSSHCNLPHACSNSLFGKLGTATLALSAT
eukprot:6188449-Pleurochrysis_carterae.AAC.3